MSDKISTEVSLPLPIEPLEERPKSRKTLYGILSLVVIVMAFFVWKSHFFSETLYIAVAGPIDEKNINGEAMKQGVQLAIDLINRKGGIHGKQVKLLTFNDQNDPKIAEKRAKEIVDSKALAVIGHYTSKASLAAAQVYQEQGIPAISGSATTDELTQGNDWYFRVIFNNSDQGAQLAYYVRKILGYKKASILFENDAYGSALADTFAKTARLIGLKIEHQWRFDDKNNFDNTLINEVVNTLEKEKSGILFLATHSKEAAEMVIKLRQPGHYKMPIIGADAIASRAFLQKIGQDVREQYQPGYYTDGIYMTTPFLFDLAGKRVVDFKKAFELKYTKLKKVFESKYQEDISTTAVIYYDAALVILHALAKLPQDQTETREQLKESLWQISNYSNAVEGVSGPIYFDKNGDVDKSIPIGVFYKGSPTVAWYQYRQKSNSGSQQTPEEILQKVFAGDLIKANGKFKNKADVVYVGMEFNEISKLDTKQAIYTADFYIWFRFKSDSQFNADESECDTLNPNKSYNIKCDVHKIEFINIVDSKNGELKKPTMTYKNSSIVGDTITKTYRIKAQFKSDFDFHHYPLDQQILSIQLRHQHKTRNTLIYAVDTQGMRQNTLVERVNANNAFSINGWLINKIALYENIQWTDSTFGNPEFFHSEYKQEYSRLNVAIEIKRHVVSFFWKNLFTNILLIILGYGIFFINTFSTQVGLGVNLILPTSILHIRLTSELPTLAYFTLLEYTFFLIYFLAVSSLLLVISMHIHEGDEEKAKKRAHALRLAGKIGYPLVVIIGIVLLIAYF
jgi:branched-chain amino acid transport system substrate-binding protein